MDTQLFVFFVFSSPLALKDSKIQAKYLPSSGQYDLGLYKVGGSHCCLLRALPPPPTTTSRRGHLHLPYNLAWLLCFFFLKKIAQHKTHDKIIQKPYKTLERVVKFDSLLITPYIQRRK